MSFENCISRGYKQIKMKFNCKNKLNVDFFLKLFYWNCLIFALNLQQVLFQFCATIHNLSNYNKNNLYTNIYINVGKINKFEKIQKKKKFDKIKKINNF